MPAETFLRLQNLEKSYGSLPVLRGLNANFAPGEFVALLGPSGCGKSTLLRLLAGLEAPSAGQIAYAASDPQKSFVFQDPTLLPWQDVLTNVLLPVTLGPPATSATLIPHGETAARAAALLAQVRLAGFERYFPNQLSGGMRMRVSLARALMIRPEAFFLDEPFAALDEDTRETLDQDLRALFESGRMNVFFVTHSVAEAAFVADRILLLGGSSGSSLIADLPSPLRGRARDAELRFDPAYVAFCRDLKRRMKELA